MSYQAASDILHGELINFLIKRSQPTKFLLWTHTTVAPAQMFMQDEYTAQFFPITFWEAARQPQAGLCLLGNVTGELYHFRLLQNRKTFQNQPHTLITGN